MYLLYFLPKNNIKIESIIVTLTLFNSQSRKSIGSLSCAGALVLSIIFLPNSSSKSVTSSSSVLLISTEKSAKTNAKTLFYVVRCFSHITFLKIEMFTSINCSLFHQISSKLLHVWYANKANLSQIAFQAFAASSTRKPARKGENRTGRWLGVVYDPIRNLRVKASRIRILENKDYIRILLQIRKNSL